MPEPSHDDASGLPERVDRARTEAAGLAEEEPRRSRRTTDPNILQARLALESLRRAGRMHSAGPASNF